MIKLHGVKYRLLFYHIKNICTKLESDKMTRKYKRIPHEFQSFFSWINVIASPFSMILPTFLMVSRFKWTSAASSNTFRKIREIEYGILIEFFLKIYSFFVWKWHSIFMELLGNVGLTIPTAYASKNIFLLSKNLIYTQNQK